MSESAPEQEPQEPESAQEPLSGPETSDRPETEEATSEAPAEPPASDEAAPGLSPAEPDESQPSEPEPEPEPEQPAAPEPPAGLSEKQMEKTLRELDRQALRHAERVQAIMGEDFAALLACPMCANSLPGFRWNVMPEGEKLAAIKQALGEPLEPDYAQDPHSTQCRECRGEGLVKTGSRVAVWKSEPCAACKGKGWIATDGVRTDVVQPALAAAPEPGNGQQQPPDWTERPEERMLKEMGAIVVWPPKAPVS